MNTSRAYIYVEDADALDAEWVAANVEGRLNPPEDTPYGLREMGLCGPDGNLFHLGSEMGVVEGTA